MGKALFEGRLSVIPLLQPIRRCGLLAFVGAIGIGIVLFANGCSSIHEVPISDPRPSDTPAVEALPIVMGVHYSTQFRNYVSSPICPPPTYRVAQTFNYEIGRNSVAIFDYALKAMFERVVSIDTWPVQLSDSPKVHAIIRPEILSADLPRGQLCTTARNAIIKFKANLHSPSGSKISEWEFSGEGIWDPETVMRLLTLKSPLSFAGDATRDALRDAVAKFVLGFRDAPQVRHWIESHKLNHGRAQKAVPQSNSAEASPGDRIVLLQSNPNIPDCVEGALLQTGADIKFSSWQNFRDSLFPWLEGNFSLNNPARLDLALQTAPVQQRIGRLGIRYLVEISGGTSLGPAEGFIGAGMGAIAGVKTQERSTNLSAGIYDLRKRQNMGGVAASDSGTAVLVWLGVPFPFIPATETTACAQLADKLVKTIQAGVSSKN